MYCTVKPAEAAVCIKQPVPIHHNQLKLHFLIPALKQNLGMSLSLWYLSQNWDDFNRIPIHLLLYWEAQTYKHALQDTLLHEEEFQVSEINCTCTSFQNTVASEAPCS